MIDFEKRNTCSGIEIDKQALMISFFLHSYYVAPQSNIMSMKGGVLIYSVI